MGYSIRTQDGIVINNIPDNISPDSADLKSRVAQVRAGNNKPTPEQVKLYNNRSYLKRKEKLQKELEEKQNDENI